MILVAAAGDGEEATLDPAGDVRTVLVKAAQVGDPAAFEALMIRHERRMLRLAYRMLGNLEEAKDASQEVFVRFHRYLHSLDPGRDPSPWLHQMMLNVCRDLQRKRGRLRLVPLETAPEPAHLDPATPDPDERLDCERRIAALAGPCLRHSRISATCWWGWRIHRVSNRRCLKCDAVRWRR